MLNLLPLKEGVEVGLVITQTQHSSHFALSGVYGVCWWCEVIPNT